MHPIWLARLDKTRPVLVLTRRRFGRCATW